MKKGILESIGSVITFCLLCLVLWGVHRIGQTLNIFPPDTYVLSGSSIPADDKAAARALQDLIKDGKLLSANQVYTWTLDYYDRIFSTLIAFIGVLAAISYFYIRAESGEKVREEIRKEVQERVKIYLESPEYKENMYEGFADPEIVELKDQVEKLQEKLEVLMQSKVLDTNLTLEKKSLKKKKKP